jgi:hypothetical protein
MMPKLKVGDLVQYGMFSYESVEEDTMVQALITGFYDAETGERLTSDYTTHDTVVEASVTSNYGRTRVMLHELKLLSPVEIKPC